MEIRKLAGALGAELLDVQLDNIDATAAGAIAQALADHQVIFFRDQELSLDQFLRFAHRMGEPVEYPFVKGLAGYPHIIEVKKLEHETTNFGGVWHSDTTYLQEPPMGTMLLARQIPPFGGDTLFASQYSAYDALSDPMKRLLAGLSAVSCSSKADVSRTREDRIASDGRKEAKKEYRAEHPVVRTHPVTQRKALYVNEAHTLEIVGLPAMESRALLAFLFAHQTRPEFTCRFRWQAGSMAFWDNRCCMHNPINDYHGQRRVMHRITLKGSKPV